MSFRPCPDRELLLHGLADGELDAANALALEEHLATCGECAGAYAEIMEQKALFSRSELRHELPAASLERFRQSLASEAKDSASGGERRGIAGIRGIFRIPPAVGYAISGLALAASLMIYVTAPTQTGRLDNELVSAHVRSLLATHLTDVASTDQHTVKPWFLGRMDFSPPVVDLADKDFPLIGGRLDYVGGRVAAAIVYKRRKHPINLFIWPGTAPGPEDVSREGYNLLRWTHSGFTFTAVSDLNPAELREFRDDLLSRLR
jgi:anti-sigma factor RsiW